MLNPLEALIQKQLQRFQQGLQQALEELAAAVVESASEDGTVRVKVDGLGNLVAVEISDELLTPQAREQLQRLIIDCVQDALDRARQLKRDKISQHTPLGAMGIELPDIV